MKKLEPFNQNASCGMCGKGFITTDHSCGRYNFTCSWWCRIRNGKEHIHRTCASCHFEWLETTQQDAILASICRGAQTRYHTVSIPVVKCGRGNMPSECDWCHDEVPKYWIPTVDTKKNKIDKECFVCDDCKAVYDAEGEAA